MTVENGFIPLLGHIAPVYPVYLPDDTSGDAIVYRLLSETLYMLDYGWYVPNHAMFGPYFGALMSNMVKAASGEVTPEQAVEDVLAVLEVEIGDYLIVEE